MKSLSLIVAQAVLSTAAFASAGPADCVWQVNEQMQAECASGLALKVPLNTTNGALKILGWARAPKGKNLWMLHYADLDVGTKTLYDIHRAAIIDVQSGKVLGDAVEKYVAQKGSPVIGSPKWKWTDKSLEVTDPSYDSDLKIQLP